MVRGLFSDFLMRYLLRRYVGVRLRAVPLAPVTSKLLAGGRAGLQWRYIVAEMGDYKHLSGEPDSVQARPKNDPLREAELKTPESGLSSSEASRRLLRDG